jgi:hypothetical protein
MDNTFQKALQSGDPEELAGFPKSDLHNHSLMGCRRADMEAFFGKPIQPFDYRGKGIHDVNRWIAEVYVPVFRMPGAFEAAVSATFRQAKSDGVTILEMSIDAGFGHLIGIPPPQVAETLRTLHLAIAPEIDFRPELGFARHLPVRRRAQPAGAKFSGGLPTGEIVRAEVQGACRGIRECGIGEGSRRGAGTGCRAARDRGRNIA